MVSSKRLSLCDETARRRLTIKADAGELYDATPASVEAKYPLLHGRMREVDDLLLQEVYLVMFQRCDIGTTPFANWGSVPQMMCMFELAPTGPSLVGGMLLASRHFLFGDMPFVRNRVKDVRCRLEFDAGTDGGLGWLYNVPQPPLAGGRGTAVGIPPPAAAVLSVGGGDDDVGGVLPSSPKSPGGAASHSTTTVQDTSSSFHSTTDAAPRSPATALPEEAPSQQQRSSMAPRSASTTGVANSAPAADTSLVQPPPLPRLPANVHVSGSGIATCRVYFRMEEFECSSMPWIVQRFQLVEPTSNVAYGPVFARAFQPYESGGGFLSSPMRSGAGCRRSTVSNSDAEGGSRSMEAVASTQFGVGIPLNEMRRAKRKAVAGEERLRILKPHLYHWCLERNPSDLGAGVTVIKEVLLYFRHTFSVVRTIRLLMKAVRRLQSACRRMIDRRRNANVRMLVEWAALERQVQAQLMDYTPVTGDPVDATVYAVLKENIITTEAFKASVISDIYAQRQSERLGLSKEQRQLFGVRYRFFIQPSELLAESHRRLVERLCRAEDSPIFKDPRITEELRDRTAEKLRQRLQAQAAEQKRLELARNKGTFGTSARLLVYPGQKPTRGSPSAGVPPTVCQIDGMRSPHPPASSRRRKFSPTAGSTHQGCIVGDASSPPSSPKSQFRRSPAKKPHVRPQHLEVLDDLFDDA